MKEADLARPVVEVRDLITGHTEYEIYSYGEENVVMPTSKVKPESKESAAKALAKGVLQKELSRYDPGVEIEFTSEDRITARVMSDKIARLIGKGGKNIESVEKQLGVKISVEPKEGSLKNDAPLEYEETGGNIIVKTEPGFTGMSIDLYKGDEYLFSAHVGKNGTIRVRKRSELGRKVLQAIAKNELRMKM